MSNDQDKSKGFKGMERAAEQAISRDPDGKPVKPAADLAKDTIKVPGGLPDPKAPVKKSV